MTNTTNQQPLAADERPKTPAATDQQASGSLIEVADMADGTIAVAPDSTNAEAEQRLQRERAATDAATAATQDLAAVRDQLANYPSVAREVTPVEPVVSAPPTPGAPAAPAAANESVPESSGAVESAATAQQSPSVETPEDRNAIVKAEMDRQGVLTEEQKKQFPLEKMIELVSQKIYPSKTVETSAVSAEKPVADGPVATPSVDDPATTIEADLASRNRDDSVPAVPPQPVESVKLNPQPTVETQRAPTDESAPAPAAAEPAA